MIENSGEINCEPNLNQKRSKLNEPKDNKVRLITHIVIYAAHYYPSTKTFANDVILWLAQQHLPLLYEAIRCLHDCLSREIISGPSSSFFPPSEVPINAKLDSSFALQISDNSAEMKDMVSAYEQLKLQKFIPAERLSELLWYNCSRLLSMKSCQQSHFYYKYFRSELEIDGENWLESTPFSGLIVLLQALLESIIKTTKLEDSYLAKFKLLWARLGQLHNKHLKSPVKKLCQVVLSNYKDVLKLSGKKTTFEDYIELLLEYAFSLLFYYKYSQCEAIMRQCSSLLKMKIEFTGKLGRRTKYQVFDTPLLVMNIVESTEKQAQHGLHDEQKEEEDEKVQFVDAKQLVAKERQVQKEEKETASLNPSTFDQESILLQSPQFVEEPGKEGESSLKQISEHHLLVALGILYFEWRSTPHDEMLMQNISAAIMALLQYKIPTSFSYNFALLLLRSLNQFPRLKNTERALDQLEKLRVSFNSNPNKNCSNQYATPYQTQLGFILILAEKYMEIGLSIAAVEMFEQAGLYEQCIDGLIAKSYKQKALELVNKLIDEKGKNPRLLCMMGDILKDKEVELYEQAWGLSNNSCARAQRSLGWFYFNKGNYEKAAQSFTKATQASYYHPNTWFTLGCSYMRLNQFDKALKSFSECVSIDETQGEAWGNIASCYMFGKKIKEAYSTLRQAVKYSEGNWKLWANLLSVSLSLKQFYRYFESIEKVVQLGHQEMLTEEIFAKVVQIMKYQNETAERKRILFNYKNRIDKLFAFLEEKIGENPLVWGGKTKYCIELLEYYDILDVHYHNLHLEKKVDINDLVPDYETIESTSLTTKVNIARTRAAIVECKQCELNMAMRVGWDQNKIQCQKVRKVLEEYVDTYRQFSARADKADFRLFVQGVAKKIGGCLQQAYGVILEWL